MLRIVPFGILLVTLVACGSPAADRGPARDALYDYAQDGVGSIERWEPIIPPWIEAGRNAWGRFRISRTDPSRSEIQWPAFTAFIQNYPIAKAYQLGRINGNSDRTWAKAGPEYLFIQGYWRHVFSVDIAKEKNNQVDQDSTIIWGDYLDFRLVLKPDIYRFYLDAGGTKGRIQDTILETYYWMKNHQWHPESAISSATYRNRDVNQTEDERKAITFNLVGAVYREISQTCKLPIDSQWITHIHVDMMRSGRFWSTDRLAKYIDELERERSHAGNWSERRNEARLTHRDIIAHYIAWSQAHPFQWTGEPATNRDHSFLDQIPVLP